MKTNALKQVALRGTSLAALLMAAQAGAAHAQAPQGQPPSGVALEEVVVTAQRREESLQSVPVSVTAVTGAEIERRQIKDITSITRSAPNMAVGPAYDPTDIVVAVRGIAETVPTVGVDNSVGIYVDEVYYALTAGANAAFIDMERVEVLRGPQGTLFGRNTIAGALNITTAKPTGDFSGSVSAGLGNFKTRNFSAVVNAPLGDSLAARFVYDHQEHSGYTRSAFLNQRMDDANQDYFRATLRARPNDAWEITLTGDYFKFEGASTMQKPGYYNLNDGGLNAFLPFANGRPGDLLSNYVGGDFYTNAANINPPTDVEKYSFTGRIVARLNDHASFKSVTGYNKLTRHEGSDGDGTPYAVLDILDAFIDAHQVSQEFQLYGDAMDDRLQWIGGVYYFQVKGEQAYTANILQPLAIQSVIDQKVNNRSYAAFAQATYEIVPDLRLTGGLRYSKDKRHTTSFNHNNSYTGQYLFCALPLVTPNPTQAQCQLDGEISFKYWPWTVGLDYKPNEDTLFYAKVSKGHRSGGYPLGEQATTPITELTPFLDETAITYEAGAKLELFDRRLRFNSAFFYTKYDDIQQSFNIVGSGGTIVTVVQNVGRARYYGAELEATALIQNLRLNAALGLIDPKFTAGPFATPVEHPVTNVSKTTVSLNASYPIELGFGTLTLNGDYNWRSKIYYFEPILGGRVPISNPAAQNANIAQKAYGLLDASASLRFANAPATLTVWGRNLTDKAYKARVTGLVEGGLPLDPYIAGAPRTYGVTLKYEF